MGREEREERKQQKNSRRKKRRIVIIVAVMLLALMQYAYGALHLGYSTEDKQIVRDLAALSGMSEDKVYDLKDTLQDWEVIKENIFVYKKILDRAPTGLWSSRGTFKMIKTYPARDLLAVYEFLDNYGAGYSAAEDYLKQHAGGRSLEEIFAVTVTSREYAAYQSVNRDQIRQMLAWGYTPQDIINADSIAMAKDIKMGDVLAMKTGATKWDAIGSSLGYEFKPADTAVALNLPDGGGMKTVSSKDYESLVKDSNARAEDNKAKTEAGLAKELGLTSKQMTDYKEQGINSHDLQNAQRLAKETGKTLEEVVQQRKEGQTWEAITSAAAQEMAQKGQEGKAAE